MAGTIQVESGGLWSVAGWLFRWVLEMLADAVDESAVRATLNEIVRENLGWFSIRELPPEERVLVRNAVCESLLDRAERELPPDLDWRDRVLDTLRELIELTCGP